MPYLIHFNPYHDPKTGMFTFAKGNSTISKYNGMSKSEYIQDMASKYREKENYSKGKARRVAVAAAEMNEMNVNGYNANLKKNQKYATKAAETTDQKAIDRYTKKANKAFKDAKVSELLLDYDKQYELGKAFYKQKEGQLWFGAVGNLASMYDKGGFMEYYNEAKKTVSDMMKS